jgi:hypothetical protein
MAIICMLLSGFFLHSLLNFILVAGKMTPRKPTTRRSSRALKLKEIELGKGSSPRVSKQLEYALREEPIINTKMKKVLIQPPTFGDTKASTESNMVLPHWGELFNKISREKYPEYAPQSDPNVRVLDNQVFPNV